MGNNATDLVRLVKRAACDAVEAAKPVNVCFGKVTKTSPLQILVEQKMLLGEKQLILSRSVTDYKVKITGGNIQSYFYTGGSAQSPVSPSHVHAIGTTEITIHNGLAVGDKVVLMRQQGGQKYIVVDKIA